MASATKITALDNGPFLVTGSVLVTDAEGNHFPSNQETLALCRCGGSATKPFCDGTHTQMASSVAKKTIQPQETVTTKPSRVQKRILWSVTILLAVAFLIFGILKLTGAEPLAAKFTKWGYPTWFRLVVGVAEISGAVLLLLPRTTVLGSVGLGLLMVGAVFTHLKVGEGLQAIPALVLLTLLAAVSYARRPRATGFLR